MATELFRIFIVSSILGYVLVDGNSAGAPERCCEDGTNIVPEHLPNSPSTSPFPFSVTLESGSYTPGQNFDITLEGTSDNENFKGFMIQGRLQADDSPTGNFSSTANYQTQCTGDTAATHTNGNEKTSLTLGWTPPPVGTGGIYFRLAMVDAFDMFWANIETPCISEDPQVSAGGTVSGNNFTITLNSAVDEAFNCSLDGGSFQPCSSGDVFPDLSVGSHAIVIQFTPSGSCEASVVQLTLNFDISPPFTLEVSGTIVGSKFTVDYTVSENATCTCQLDSGTAVPCDPGHMFTDIDPGLHTITVVCTSTDSGLTATATSAFSVAVQASASASIVGDTVTLTLDSNANGTFQCSVDGGAFENCISGQVFSGFTDGSHNIRVRFTPAGSTDTISVRQLNFQIGGAFGLSVSATYFGNDITVTFETSIDATCTCQLNSEPPVPCTSPHVFTGVSRQQEHNVTVTCTSTDDSSLVAQATVSGLQYLEVTVGLETTGTAIIVIIEENIRATHKCKLDNGPFVTCFSGFRFNGVSGGEHTVTVESTSTNGLSTATSIGTITVRGEDAILITDIETDVDTITKNYTFFFNINEQLDPLEITLQIDGSPVTIPYWCHCITESRCYCTFTNDGTYEIGSHVLTFISTLNGEIRGTTNHQFLVSDVAVARFRDLTYDVVEGDRIISVVVEKFGSSTQELTAFIRYNPGTATSPGDYPSVPQAEQIVLLPVDSSAQKTANLTVEDDTILECNETFSFTLESFSGEDLLTIDPAGNRSVVTIIDDDEGTVAFSGSRPITEGDTGFITVSIQETISLSFTVTVESYECTGDDIVAATPGVDYVPVSNVTLTFTQSVTSHRIDIETIEDEEYEGDGESEVICLRIFNLVEPCPNYVSIGDDVQVLIQEDDTPDFTIFCHTVASGNSLTGWTIDLFYFTFSIFAEFTVFRCALNDATLSQCPGPSPTTYGPLSYANHTVTVEGVSAFGTQKITHQILIVLGRLGLYNSSAIQISIQSTKNATYQCRLNDWNNGSYFPCSDGDIIALPPNTYNLTVRAISTNDSDQTATDVAGPITLTGGSAVATCSGGADLVSTDGSGSTYTARWRARGERIVFELAGRGQGWVGIGFSYNRIMTDSDIVLGAADEMGFFVDDRFAFVTEQTTPPPRDAIQNVMNTSASFENGVTTVRFSRVRDTGDVNDYSLTYCIFFLYAWGGDVFNFTTGAIAYHGLNRRNTSESLVCIPISRTFCPERFNCGDPGTPENGSVVYDDTLEESVASYSCDFGFRLDGDVERVCQANATWSGAVPTCTRIDCGDPGEPSNGTGNYTDTFVGSVVSYSCDFGYELVGNVERTCQESGAWTGVVPVCERIDCGSPGTLLNGMVNSNGTFVTSVATFMCDFGYNLVGDTQRICQENGNWSNMVPVCERIDCGSPGTLMNGTVDFNGTFVTSVAIFTCDFGFDLVGDSQRVCQLNGTWSNMVPVCNPVDCGFPDVPSNGDGAVISTTLGSIVVYTCDDTYALCGDETRTCLPTGMWSGSVPNCTRAVATVDSTSHTVDEDAGPAVIGISLDQPNCVDIVIVLTPQEQSPVDASTLDFNSNPIMVTIMAGDTSGTAAIPIIDDSIVEGDEDFDAILTTDTRGAIIGTPGQAEVTIIDDGDTLTVMFEMPVYNVSETDEQVEVCLTSIGENEISVAVTVQPSETGSAEEPGDFSLATSTVTFSPGQSRACYNQAVVNDDVPEGTESFDVSIIDNPAIDIGDPGVTRIDIIDDDGRMIMRNDTVIGDPLYTVPLQISDEMVESNPEVANTSLCYEIHGRGGRIYNLVSDTCTSINAEYMGTGNDTNIVSKVGYLAVDNDGNCQEITIDVMNCRGTVGSTEVTQSNPYDTAGIRVRKGRNYFRIALPNCERQDLVSWVICEEGNMLTFVITRGFNLQPTSHGLVAQFWNVPVELQQYNGSVPDDLNYYVVKVTPADGDVREFVGHLYDVSWDFTPIPCIYAGNRNAGPVYEFDDPNDSVIEGNYTEYEVNSLFDTQFTYRQFEDSRCTTVQ